jgi:predicted nucleotidyltransferase
MDQPLPRDFKEFLLLLNSEKIDYMLVGGYAVSYHGYPRPTGDLDVWIAMDRSNAERVVKALAKFGFGDAGATPDLFLAPGKVVRMGNPPVRIEIISSISGVDFAPCRSRRIDAVLDGVPVHVIALADLVANKRAAGRPKDLNDLSHLGFGGVSPP